MRVALFHYKTFSLSRNHRFIKFKNAEYKKIECEYCLFPIMCRRLESQHVHCVSYVEEEPVAVNRMGM